MGISDIENMAEASPLYLDTDISVGNNATADLQAVVSIAITDVDMDETLSPSLDDGSASDVVIRSVGSAVALTETSLFVDIDPTGAGAASIDGQFVGLGVSGPLAVLGAWEMNANNGTVGTGAKVTQADDDGNAIGVSVIDADFGVDSNGALTEGAFTTGRIHGGFGAELP